MADDALKTVVTAVTSDRKRWFDFMMHFELGLEQPDSKRAPISAGTIAASYVVGGLIPLAPYVVMSNISKAFAYSVGFTALEATSSFHLKGWRWWINAILPGHLPILRHRGHHRVRRLLECLDRRGGCTLGRYPTDGHRSWCLHRYRHRGWRLSTGRPRCRDHVRPGNALQPAALETALCLRRASPPPRLTRNPSVFDQTNPTSLLDIRDVCRSFPKGSGEELLVSQKVDLTIH